LTQPEKCQKGDQAAKKRVQNPTKEKKKPTAPPKKGSMAISNFTIFRTQGAHLVE